MSEADESPAQIGHRIVSGGIELLRSRLLHEPPPLPLKPRRGDFDLNPQNRPKEERTLTPAAVLVPLILREEPHVLLTQRTDHLSRHAGQVAFPGGRADPEDISLVETALRETQEETGIDPAFVTVAGYLDAYETGTGYAILPVVGILSDGFALTPHEHEVAHIFEVPLSFLLDPANRVKQSREFQGRQRSFYSYTYNDRYIWGATAAMLINFAERITAP
ncbi:MAG: CoA pyrophosphatase [Alphaproteobacteria bacterium]|nr:CoA pyrophosphatase [Alphaproteobacteria bacterium]MBV9903945.1 CoA pyrophosphatase [Alphaproteobacteria bacterium]